MRFECLIGSEATMRGCDQLIKKKKNNLHLIHTSVLGLPCSLSALKSLHTYVQMGSDLASIFTGIFYDQCFFFFFFFFMLAADLLDFIRCIL